MAKMQEEESEAAVSVPAEVKNISMENFCGGKREHLRKGFLLLLLLY